MLRVLTPCIYPFTVCPLETHSLLSKSLPYSQVKERKMELVWGSQRSRKSLVVLHVCCSCLPALAPGPELELQSQRRVNRKSCSGENQTPRVKCQVLSVAQSQAKNLAHLPHAPWGFSKLGTESGPFHRRADGGLGQVTQLVNPLYSARQPMTSGRERGECFSESCF